MILNSEKSQEMKTKIYLNSMFPLDCLFIAIFSQETNRERESIRQAILIMEKLGLIDVKR